MQIGTGIQTFGMHIFVAYLSYEVIGVVGPIIVVGLYALGMIVNWFNRGRKVTP